VRFLNVPSDDPVVAALVAAQARLEARQHEMALSLDATGGAAPA